ncbi:MAG: hydroxymethylpyrimidine/phosphomethylpyrimidine kinase [Herminiimonas sp.]|nr:hydroxymethylpyrimidine/phosphomethylpyrimidine kinase [Herminiimonas sp.]MDB5855269.1 hydroxymethylpyrimidine/phosphomethylpyrimidine kinase [Herminiimonas sp.]
MKRACVLVFAGLDPSGGAGLHADIMAIAAQGAHPLAIASTLTVQDNDRVQAVHPVAASLIRHQAQVLLDKIDIAAVKIGIVGSRANAEVIAEVIATLRARHPAVPVVLDPVLASGHGDALSREDAVAMLGSLRGLATLITPNLPEALALTGQTDLQAQAARMLEQSQHVLIKGGHGVGDTIINSWFQGASAMTGDGLSRAQTREWKWPRLPGEFHGSGCTLASAIAALLARGATMEGALNEAQTWCQASLAAAYSIASGQLIPGRFNHQKENA